MVVPLWNAVVGVTWSAVLGLGLGWGCGGDGSSGPSRDAGPGAECASGEDLDGDRIRSSDEGRGDADRDGRPNDEDTDSDADGFSDREEAGDDDCGTPPIDLDGDGKPDFVDPDANGDGIPDRDQDEDQDGDGVLDRRELDLDGDGIPNVLERGGTTGPPVDTDGDGIPDVWDLDSDADTIGDEIEGRLDVDRDGDANYRDLDSDGDGILDSVEAGDADIETPPAVCPEEIDPVTGVVRNDAFADFIDADSDNDGFADGEEVELGTDPCDVDTDDDGLDDLAEGAYERINCPTGSGHPACGCATTADCRIPPEHFYVVLPLDGMPVEEDLDFGTTLRTADVFFLTDSTTSMSGTLNNVKATVGQPGVGLIDRIGQVIADSWFSGGQHDDFPFVPYGGGPDEVFRLAIGSTPQTLAGMPAGSGRDAVATAFGGLVLHGGGDGPEAHTEALYQVVTGEGGNWMNATGDPYSLRAYAGDCLGRGWGAPCFRDEALAMIVHFSDICAHEAPPGGSVACTSYTGISPAPVLWTDMAAAMNARGVKYIGANTTAESCATPSPADLSPCHFMTETARETGSVDLDGQPLVYDLPNGSSSEVFVDTVVAAVETLATRVPLDVDTALRDDPSDPQMVDAGRFVKRRQPSCRAAPDPADPCFWPPTGITPEQAVGAIDDSTFFGVVPGTQVQFRVTFQNDFYEGSTSAEIFVAFIDVRADGNATLDTRQVFVVVPANSAAGPA